MEGIMVNEMFWKHCCHCGYRISKSAPGTKSLLVCPKCGSELEVAVDGKAVKVTGNRFNYLFRATRKTFSLCMRARTRAYIREPLHRTVTT